MWFCRYCCRPVGLAARRCPRCHHWWPAATPKLLRLVMEVVLFAVLLAAAVRLAWGARIDC